MRRSNIVKVVSPIIAFVLCLILLVIWSYNVAHSGLVRLDTTEKIVEASLEKVFKQEYILRESSVISDAKTDVEFNITDTELSISEFKVSEEKSGNTFCYSYSSDDTKWSEYISYEDESWYSYIWDSSTENYVRCNVEEIDVQRLSDLLLELKECENVTDVYEEHTIWDNEECYVLQQMFEYEEDDSFSVERYYISMVSLLPKGSIMAHYTPLMQTGSTEEDENGVSIEGNLYMADVVRTTYSYSEDSLHFVEKPPTYITEDEYYIMKEDKSDE